MSSLSCTKILDIKDLGSILGQLQQAQKCKWYDLGLLLGIYQPTLEAIQVEEMGRIDPCFRKCLSAWLNRADNVDEKGQPTLLILAEKLKEIGDKKSAEEIYKLSGGVAKNPSKVRLLTEFAVSNTEILSHDNENHALALFRKYADQFVNVINYDEVTCLDFLLSLREEHLISISEINMAEKISHLAIKTNMIVRTIGSLLQNGRKPEITLNKVILMIENYDQDFFEEMMTQAAMSDPCLLNEKIRLKKYGIQISAINESQVQLPNPSSIKMYSEVIKEIYKWQKQHDVIANEPAPPFIEPVMVEIDSWDNQIINGSIENLKKTGKIISMHFLGSIPHGSRYLIEGRSGFGKTKLAFELRDRWVKCTALLGYHLFFFMRLGDPSLQKEFASQSDKRMALRVFIKSFMTDESWNDDAYQNVIDTEGDGVFILLEGFNELSEAFANESVFFNIIIGRFLPKATVLITSQPFNTDIIRRTTNNLHVIRIVGFDEAAVSKFVTASIDMTKHHLFECLPCKILSCTFIPVILRWVTFLLQGVTTERDQILPKSTITELYKLLTECIIESSCNDKIIIECSKPELCKIAWEGFENEQISFDRTDFETLGLMNKEYSYSSRKTIVYYRFLHSTIQEFMAASFLDSLPSDKVEEIFQKYKNNLRFSGVLTFLAGLAPQYIDMYISQIFQPKPTKLKKAKKYYNSKKYEFQTTLKKRDLQLESKLTSLDNLHWLYEVQCTGISKGATGASISMSSTFPLPHDMLALGYCISKSHTYWTLGFTLRSISMEHIRMLVMGIGQNPAGKIKELNLSLNQLAYEGLTALLKIPDCVFQSLTLLNLRGNGLRGIEASAVVTTFLALSSLEKFYFHYNLFDQNEQFPIIEAICRSVSLTHVSLSNLSPKECQVLMSHVHRSLKKIDFYQLESDSLLTCFQSLKKCSINTLKIYDSQMTQTHSRLLSEKLHTSITSIKSLELVNCAIDDESLQHIAEPIVCKNSKIKKLNLRDNLISNDGCYTIIKLIQSKCLKHLQLQGNPFGEIAVQEIVFASNPVLKIHLSMKWKTIVDSRNTFIFD